MIAKDFSPYDFQTHYEKYFSQHASLDKKEVCVDEKNDVFVAPKCFTAAEIAQRFGFDYHGEPRDVVRGLCDARYLAKDRLLVVAPKSFLPSWTERNSFFLIEENDEIALRFLKKENWRYFVVAEGQSKRFLIELLKLFAPQEKNLSYSLNDLSLKEVPCCPKYWVAPSAKIAPGVVCGPRTVIEEGASVGANVVLGADVFIGKNTIIHPCVTIYDRVFIGENCIIHAGSVLGADGFGYEMNPDGTFMKIPQIGRVVVHDDVEIGSNVSIDRATISVTRIFDRVKIDNLVQIAHNVEINSDCIIVGQSGVAGSSVLGRNVVLAGQVGVSDHCVIGDGVQIGAQSGVASYKKIPAGAKVLGSPVMDLKKRIACEMALRKLAEK